MQLKLTWRITGPDQDIHDINLLVPDEQKITETLQVLAESGMIEEDAANRITYVKSLRTHNQIPVEWTYQEGNIFSGDILQTAAGGEWQK